MKHREIFDSKLGEISSGTDKYFSDAENYCNSLDIKALDDLRYFKRERDKLDEHEMTIKSIQINFKIDTIKMLIDREFSSKLGDVENERNNLMLSLRNKIESAMDRKRSEIRSMNEEIRSKNEALKAEIDAANSRYRQLEIKRQRLLEYSSEILQLCADYGIKVSDININNDMFSIEELDVFYEQFYTFISMRGREKKNPVSWIRDKAKDNPVTLAIILSATIYMSFTPALDFVAIGLLLYIIYGQSIQESLVKKYTIMAGLVFNINPMELGVIKEIPEDMIEQELSEDIDIDNEPEFQSLLEEVNNSMENFTDEDIRFDMAKSIAAYTQDYPGMERDYNNLLSAINERKNSILGLISSKRKELKDKEDELKSKVKLLGEEFSESGILSTQVKVGLDESTFIYETMDIGMQNIIFNQKGNDPKQLDTFIKVMLTNYLCNVRPGFLDVTVYDPNGSGRSLAGFYNDELEQVFNISNNNLEEIIKELTEYTDKVIKTTKGKSITEYNEMVSKQERITLNYKLLLIMSQPKTVEESEALRSFIEYSANFGVFVWMVTDTTFPKTKVFQTPFEGVRHPIKIDAYEFPVEVMSNMEAAFKALKSPSLVWDVFKDKAIPDDKIWTYNADEFIDLDPGFEDGDPSKSKGYTVGNTGDVHAIGVGGTGAGKSVFINNLIANLVTKYSPKDIALWLVDFKGTEFNFYLQKPEIGQDYILPHIEACLCTSDPDYSVSLFGALRAMADERYSFLKAKGFKNMYEYNKAMRKQGRHDECLRRTIMIADEFQVIFEKTDAKSQALLKADITQIAKVARACGIHLLFFSQSMKGTISDDILSQFTLRFALRCPMEVSLSVMGTKYAGDIREKNGYLYVSSSDDKKKELQKRYRTPFIPDAVLRERISLIAKRAISENIIGEKAITYDEADVHNISEIDSLYDNDLRDVDTQSLFILGERMVYSKEGRRSNMFLARENNQHIFSAFSNTKDTVMFFKTMMKNISRNGEGQCIFNSQVSDLGYLCEVDKYLTDNNSEFYSEENTPASLLTTFQQIVAVRKTKDPETLKPLYIFCIGWDKAIGFGIDSKYPLTEAYTTLLQLSAILNIHFIFIVSDQGDIPKAVVMACKHRIAGKASEKTSTTLLDSDAAYKTYSQKDGYMFLRSDGFLERLKIYQSEMERIIQPKTLKI